MRIFEVLYFDFKRHSQACYNNLRKGFEAFLRSYEDYLKICSYICSEFQGLWGIVWVKLVICRGL